jgi:hypothetical protein
MYRSAISALAAVLIVGASLATRADEKTVMVGGAAMFPSKNIIQNAVNSKDHTTLVALSPQARHQGAEDAGEERRRRAGDGERRQAVGDDRRLEAQG